MHIVTGRVYKGFDANNIAQPKQIRGLALHFIFHSFSSFNCCLSVVLQLNKVYYPENSHVVFCHNKQPSLEPFMCLGLIRD